MAAGSAFECLVLTPRGGLPPTVAQRYCDGRLSVLGVAELAATGRARLPRRGFQFAQRRVVKQLLYDACGCLRGGALRRPWLPPARDCPHSRHKHAGLYISGDVWKTGPREKLKFLQIA